MELSGHPDLTVGRYWEAIEAQAKLDKSLRRDDIDYAYASMWRGETYPRSARIDWVAQTRHMLRAITTTRNVYWWAPHTVTLVEQASRNMPAYTLTPETLPSPAGFAYLGKHVDIASPSNRPLLAVGWLGLKGDGGSAVQRGPGGVLTMEGFFAPTADAPDIIMFVLMILAEEPLSTLVPVTLIYLEPGHTLEYTLDYYKKAMTEHGDYHPESEAANMNALRLWACMLSFIEQRIVQREEWILPRNFRRRLEHSRQHEASQRTLQVVYLRRRDGSATGTGKHQKQEWDHQWLVSGHWRQQAHGPNYSLRKPIYIHPYLKGPEDKPFTAPGPRVFGVIR